jgi:hypothetical protein
MAICPWGWSQIKKTKDFTQMLTYKTYSEAGIALTQGVIYNSDTFYFNHNDLSNSHTGIQIGIALSPEDPKIDYSLTKNFIQQIKSLTAA